MIKFDKDYIPLVLERNDMLSAYIIDNVVLGFEETYSLGTYPFRAYNLLLQLYNNHYTRKSIPKQFHEYFKNKQPILRTPYANYLVGAVDQISQFIISLDMNISEDSKKPVKLENIFYSHKDNNGKNYSDYNTKQISLSGEEAFIIFANILTNARCDEFDYFLSSNRLVEIENLDIVNEISAQKEWFTDLYGPSYLSLNEFAYEYLLYLKDKLLRNILSPYFIQHYSGSRLLVFLHYLKPIKDYFISIHKQLLESNQLSFNERLMYSIFLHMFKYYNTDDEQISDLIQLFPIINSYCRISYKKFPYTK